MENGDGGPLLYHEALAERTHAARGRPCYEAVAEFWGKDSEKVYQGRAVTRVA